MAKYKLLFKKSVTKDLRAVPKSDVSRILQRIDALASDPRGDGCRKLSGAEVYRVRQGMYRIVYEIRGGELVVLVVKVAQRSSVYRSI